MSSILSRLINLAGNITGLLPVANGGTNLASGTSGGVLGYTASGTLASSALLAANGVVIGGGAGATPTATAAGTNGQLLVGVTSGAPAWGSSVSAATTFTGGVVFNGGGTNLNWYEESTFTPTLGGDGSDPTVTYTTQLGVFTRIGRVMYFRIRLVYSASSGGSGNAIVRGLPYSSANTNPATQCAANISNIALPASLTAVTGNINVNATTIYLLAYGSGNALADSFVTVANTQGGSFSKEIALAGFYFV